MTLLLTNDDVGRLVGTCDLIEVLDRAYRANAGGTGVSAPRLDLQAAANPRDETYQLGVVAGLTERYGAIRIKSDMTWQRVVGGRPRKEKYCVAPGTWLGLVLLFSIEDGALLAILHDGLLQKMRVGADSAIGARYLARGDAETLGILGAGGMARTHLEALTAVRPIRRVRIFSPTPVNREALAAEARQRGLDAAALDRPENVLAAADIVCACTSAIGPVIHGRDLRPGTHITAIGGTLDADASARIDVALRLGSATAPAELPDWGFEEECLSFVPPTGKATSGGTRRFADVPPGRRFMLAELLADPSRGRTSAEQITFSERGNIHGLQFAAAAGLAYERARAAGIGEVLPSECFLETIRN